MIDTLHLNLRDFEIDVEHALEVGLGSINHGTGIMTGNSVLWRNGGGEQRGSKATYNAPNFNLTIKPSPQGQVWAIASFSAPKLATGSNYQPADAETLKSALKALQSDLKSIGVKTNVENATISRLDATKNVVTDESFSSYYPMLSALPCRLRDKWYYGSSLLLKNTQQELAIYDKLAEMTAKKHSVKNLPVTMRFEQRFTTGTKVKNYLGMSQIKDVIANLDHVKQRYQDSMKSNIFKLDTFDFEVVTKQQFIDELTIFKQRNRFGVASYLTLRGYMDISHSEQSFLEAVAEVYENRATISNAKKKLHELKMQAMSLETPSKDKKTSGQLYEELKKKVLS